MILTAAFIISKAIGATWSWWWLILTIIADHGYFSYDTNTQDNDD